MGNPSRRLRAPAAALLLLFLVIGTALPAAADPGDPDTSFGGDGEVRTDFAGGLDSVLDVVVQPNGHPVAVGRAVDGEAFVDSDFAVARYVTFGDPDGTFGGGDGKTRLDFIGTGDVAQAVALMANGKIVMAGLSNNADVGSRFAVARLKPGGAPDVKFSGDGRVRTAFPGFVSAQAYDVAIQGTAKVVVVGEASADSQHRRGDPGIQDIAIARYKKGGALDDTFGGDGRVTTDFAGGNESARAVVVTESGRILVAAHSTTLADETRVVLARYLSNGSLDPDFSGDGKLVLNMVDGERDMPVGLAVRDDGKIVVGASVRNAVSGSSGYDLGVALVNANGTLATSFGDQGFAFADFGDDEQPTDMFRDTNGKIYFSATRPQAGEQSAAIEVFRLDASGEKSLPYGDGGVAVVEFGEFSLGQAVALDTSHRAVAAGQVDSIDAADFAVVRLEA